VHDRCQRIQRSLSSSDVLPPQADNNAGTGKYNACSNSVALLRRSQPSMLDRWTPIYIEGDGNCMFRAVSQAVFGSQEYHMQLRLLACLEVGTHRPTYDKSNPACHELLKRDTLVPPPFDELWQEMTALGESCCYVALLALSCVVRRRICSFFPPLQSTFVSPLTTEIVGRSVDADSRSIAVMWSTVWNVPPTGEVKCCC